MRGVLLRMETLQNRQLLRPLRVGVERKKPGAHNAVETREHRAAPLRTGKTRAVRHFQGRTQRSSRASLRGPNCCGAMGMGVRWEIQVDLAFRNGFSEGRFHRNKRRKANSRS